MIGTGQRVSKLKTQVFRQHKIYVKKKKKKSPLRANDVVFYHHGPFVQQYHPSAFWQHWKERGTVTVVVETFEGMALAAECPRVLEARPNVPEDLCSGTDWGQC